MSQQSSPHDGKHFVVQKGKAQCNQGDHSDGNNDFLAVTEDDLQFNPSGPSFGKCKLKPSSGGNLPCSYAPAGKWQKTYGKVKIMDKKIVTEVSELQCVVGGRITIKDHGQRGQMSKKNVKNADNKTVQHINPLVNMQDYKETVLESEIDAY